jgi:hypothetical protein
MEVLYEDLVRSPSAELERVCDFIELDYSEQMLEYPDRASSLIRRTRVPEAHTNIGRPPVLGIRDWRDELSLSESVLLERLGGDLLAELGYPLKGRSLSEGGMLWLSAKARAVRGQWWLDHQQARLRARGHRRRMRLQVQLSRREASGPRD